MVRPNTSASAAPPPSRRPLLCAAHYLFSTNCSLATAAGRRLSAGADRRQATLLLSPASLFFPASRSLSRQTKNPPVCTFPGRLRPRPLAGVRVHPTVRTSPSSGRWPCHCPGDGDSDRWRHGRPAATLRDRSKGVYRVRNHETICDEDVQLSPGLLLIVGVAMVCPAVMSAEQFPCYPIGDAKKPHVQELGGWAVTEHVKQSHDKIKFSKVTNGEEQVRRDRRQVSPLPQRDERRR
ncbi:hypothetical protein BRADI_1g70523v3 [Brachypodium distachyon]|uniref:Cystatin domain-containing protein n=1 Tax=Brachypodium distachyon TaxID=15368 RepID=A0A0Q3NZ41_BRADI|nr:hypothetical protein BRADI_1g70523v3 [Brachypodium distachyon]